MVPNPRNPELRGCLTRSRGVRFAEGAPRVALRHAQATPLFYWGPETSARAMQTGTREAHMSAKTAQAQTDLSALLPFAEQSRSTLLREAAYDGLNRFIALLLLMILSPVMAAVALAIRMTDGAPILFGHYRVGKGGRLIKVLKFRSMRIDAQQRLAELLANDLPARAEWERDFKLNQDPRITPIGYILRRTSLDELPQLFNVLRGDMRLVGPRPITAQELRRYGPVRWHYLSVTPGVTGLWQVSGRNQLTYAQRVELDRQYVTNRSIALDISILLRTVLVVATGRGAC